MNGFIIEGASAGGHNAPPRGRVQLDSKGEPVYGQKDVVDLERIKEFELPFWLAGSYGDPARIEHALEMGAQGVQLGTVFALCEESGLLPVYKKKILQKIALDEAKVFTDPKASPTGFPFKIFQLEESISEQRIYEERPRVCDLGYLRTVLKNEKNETQYRCPSEPNKDYYRKCGQEEDISGYKCLCNGLLANIGLAQIRKSGYIEPPLITAGEEVSLVKRFLNGNVHSYSAADVIEALCPPTGSAVSLDRELVEEVQ